jgi:hypothetical protein
MEMFAGFLQVGPVIRAIVRAVVGNEAESFERHMRDGASSKQNGASLVPAVGSNPT